MAKTKYKKVGMVQCSNCRKLIDQRHLARHQASKRCSGYAEAHAILDPVLEMMAARQWKRVGNAGWVHTLTQANIPVERALTYVDWRNNDGIISNEGEWAPAWAVAVVSAGGTVAQRQAILRACASNPELRDAVHATLLMQGRDSDVINIICHDWDLLPPKKRRPKAA